MKVIVVQRGARHRYAVARMLELRNMLEALYTDSNGTRGMGKMMGHLPWVPGRLKKLADRKVEGVPKERIRTADGPVLFDPYLARISRSPFEYYKAQDQAFAKALKSWGVGGADTVYSMMGEGWAFLEEAKGKGLRVLLDVFCIPVMHKILAEERKLYRDWDEEDRTDYAEVEEVLNKRWAAADLLLCPSPAVIDGLRYYSSFNESKVRLVRYGHAMDIGRFEEPVVHGKALFGGSATLGKGIHYYAEAARMLEGTGVECYAAGGVTERVRQRPETRAIRFLGPLRRGDFLREMRSAAAFVLPTLAEGSASVVFEALCCGVPVVTTRSAGSVVTDGKEGRIVPERDAEALAKAIKEIALDPDLRAAMSAEALKTAAEYTEEKWGERLVEALI